MEPSGVELMKVFTVIWHILSCKEIFFRATLEGLWSWGEYTMSAEGDKSMKGIFILNQMGFFLHDEVIMRCPHLLWFLYWRRSKIFLLIYVMMSWLVGGKVSQNHTETVFGL
jgi:hypothetical protein